MNDKSIVNCTQLPSEKWLVASFLAISGGLQDAYSYLLRDGVFANAQTGNIVLLSRDIFTLNVSGAFRYIIPLSAFVLGIFVVELIRNSIECRQSRVNWQQVVLLIEVVLLTIVGFLPAAQNHSANALISFACAMQVQTFRIVDGKSYSSTMCIGNLRTFAERLFTAIMKRSLPDLHHAFGLFVIIILFALGAGIGYLLSEPLKLHSICASSILLLLAACAARSKKQIQ